ncbi:MAG: hypothetical protein PHY48_01825 [Candidatus Cloacimonetes bacterium]|nr:hypothetical protein [Candidatus Cloacimonadota bacterium]
MKTAPVFIGTLDRSWHLQQALESLKACEMAKDTHLFIALDYPSRQEHYAGYQRSLDYLENLDGFRELTVIKRDKNLGGSQNFVCGKTQIFKYYDRIISSEDDNYFSPNFLEYMNLGLEKFKDDPKVFSISGYNLPLPFNKGYSANYFLHPGAFVWGMGIWRDRYEKVCVPKQDVGRRLWNPLFVLKNGLANPVFIAGMLAIAQGRQIWDPFSEIAIGLHTKQHKMYSVFPTLSKVRNLGHDGTGVRCKAIEGKNIFAEQTIDDASGFVFEDNGEKVLGNPAIKKIFKDYYKGKPMSYLRIMKAMLKFYLQTGIE